MSTADHIEMNVYVMRQMFYNEESNYGIYGVLPDKTDNIKLNEYGNIVVKGVMQKLAVDANYAVVVKPVRDRYGESYEIVKIKQDLPTDPSMQRAYLTTIMTPLQVEAIYNVFDETEDIIEMFKTDTFEYQKVNGFGQVTYERVREKVLGSLEIAEALATLSQYGLNYNMVSKLVKHYGNAELLMQKLKENPYILTEVDGIGFKKCDAYALKMGIEEDSPYRINACVKYVLEEATNDGHCWLREDVLINEMNGLLNIGKKPIQQFIATYEGNKYFIEYGRVALYYLYRQEKYIAERLITMLHAQRNVKINMEKIDEIIVSVEQEQGFQFTDEQRDGIIVACKANVLIINGKAGTGKTTILKGIISVLNRATEKPINYETCALSGKAAQRINESTGLKSSTIHRLLGYNPTDGGFQHDEMNPLQTDETILDEASMTNVSIFCSLVRALPLGSAFIIQGDIEQLESIGAGNVLKDLIESAVIPVVTLTQVHRQAMKSGILSTANQVREGIQFADEDDFGNRRIGELKDLDFRPYERKKPEKIFNFVVRCAQGFYANNILKGTGDIYDFQVIVPLKERGLLCTRELNLKLQEVFNGEMKPSIEYGKTTYKEGDKIIQNGNNYDANVFNGTLGIIESVHIMAKASDSFVLINFQGVGTVKYLKEDLKQIDLAYALSVHRVQGSQFKNVVFAFDYSAFKLLSRQLVYTALTRAINFCCLAVELEALLYAVRTNKSAKRNTFLIEFLRKN